MKPLRIHIVLPFPVTKPVGGAKVMYEYANRLSARGHAVQVFHALDRPFKTSSTPRFLRRWLFALRGVRRPRWFPLDTRVKCHIVNEISDRYLPEGDIILSTWWQMTYAIARLSPSRGRRFNLIQDYEIWKGDEERVIESYRLPVHHLVIARYLQELLRDKAGVPSTHIPNAIDTGIFRVTTPATERHPRTLMMLYSEEPRKGSDYGLRVLRRLASEMPDLQVILFGVYPPPAELPARFEYYRRPDNLPALYNRATIFVTPSRGEGWALPPAEAMACGCALVCTRIGGHLDYADEGRTALLFTPGDEEEMYQKLKILLGNDELCRRLSLSGQEQMTHTFHWERSVDLLERVFRENEH